MAACSLENQTLLMLEFSILELAVIEGTKLGFVVKADDFRWRLQAFSFLSSIFFPP